MSKKAEAKIEVNLDNTDDPDDDLKEHLSHYAKELNKSDTILSQLPCFGIKSFPTTVLAIILLFTSLVYLIGDIGGIDSLGFGYSLFATIVFFNTIAIFILHCNYFIALEALQSISFLVRSDMLYVDIA